MRLMKLAILTCPLALTGLASLWAENWKPCVNPRFGAFAEAPSDHFKPLPPPDNGDDQRFSSRDGASLAIFGANNIDDASPAAYDASLRSGDASPCANVTCRAPSPPQPKSPRTPRV